MPLSASAQNDVARPVKILVPLPPGGTSDLFSRLVADTLLGTPLDRLLSKEFRIDPGPGFRADCSDREILLRTGG